VTGDASLPFESLDFVYMPSADVAAELEHCTTVLGGEVGWAIERFGTRVAMVRLAAGPPELLLAEHLEGAIEALAARGWEEEMRAGMPFGPLSIFATPGGVRLALYENTRPHAAEMLAGRRDF
jgi:hypothetical protein